MEDIEEVEWRPQPERPNLYLHLTDGKTIPLRLRKGAGLWNAKLHDLLDQSLFEDHNLPKNGRDEKSQEQEDGKDERTT